MCLVTVTAFAAYKSGSFLVNFAGKEFSGEYAAKLNVYVDRANASLNIYDYNGFVNGIDDSKLRGTVYGVKEDGDSKTLADFYDEGLYSCSDGRGYSAGTYNMIIGNVTYTFANRTLCTLTETVTLQNS